MSSWIALLMVLGGGLSVYLIGNGILGIVIGKIFDPEDRDWTYRDSNPIHYWLQVLLNLGLGVLVVSKLVAVGLKKGGL